MSQQSEPTLGQRLLRLSERGVIAPGELFLMFINAVPLDNIPGEVEALPPAFQRELNAYLATLGIGSPGWDECFLVGAVYHFGSISPEQTKELYQGIARKNRVTAEAIWQYFRRREVG
jgi:hypothetical protein